MHSRFLIVIAGPTAIGKTELSIKLAKKLETEIISADSRQFYRELEIGTAKPSKLELEEVNHHFINSLSIKDDYSVGQYEKDGLQLIDKLFENKDSLILTGGSGLFIKAITEGLDSIPEIDTEIRKNLKNTFEEQGLKEIQNQLLKLDKEAGGFVDMANPQRVMRAIEVLIQTGRPLRFFQSNIKKPRDFHVIKIGLEMPRAELYQRINSRMDIMLENGLVKEVENLRSFEKKNALQTVGYKEVFGYFNQEYSYEKMVDLLKRNTRRYAKRQMTWFKNQDDFEWFNPKEYEQIELYVKSQLKIN